MIDIGFMKKYLVQKKSKKVRVTMRGMVELEINIFKFDFEMLYNILKIKDDGKNIIEIKFDEVREVELKNNKVIIIYFNFNEEIDIK